MSADHASMLLVLSSLAEGSAESGEVAVRLGFNRKHVSVVLSRCFRRGLVEREPYRRGRERGFVYGLSEKGAEWIWRKASRKAAPVERSRPEEAEVPEAVPVAPSQTRSSAPTGPDYALVRDLALTGMLQVATSLPRPPQSDAMRRMATFLCARQGQSEGSAFLLNEEEKKKGMEAKEALMEVSRGYHELVRMFLRFLAPTGKSKPPRHSEYGRILGRYETLVSVSSKLGEMTRPILSLPPQSSWQERQLRKNHPLAYLLRTGALIGGGISFRQEST